MKKTLLVLLFCCLGIQISFGQSWTRKVSGSGLGNSLFHNPLNNNTILGSPNSTSLYISHDKGNTWQVLASISGASGITGGAMSNTDTNQILIAQKGSSGSDRIMKSTNYGQTWTQVWTGTFSYYGVPMEFKPQHPDTVFVMSGNQFFRSTNFGSTWTLVSTVSGFNVWCDCEVNPADARILLIGDNTAGIWKSTDGGLTWAQKYTTSGEIPMIAIDPFKPNVAYATKWSGGGGFIKSTDYGETWQSIATFNGVSMWAVSTSLVERDFVMTCSYSGQNMRFSTDAGETWTLQNQNLAGSGYGSLAIDNDGIFALQGDGIYKYNSGVTPTPPSAPSLGSPANGTENLPSTVTVSWGTSSGASSYRLQVARDASFTDKIFDDSTLTTTSKIFTSLSDTTNFYWHVRAKNAYGSSSYTSTWRFKTGTTLETRLNLAPDGGGYIFSSSGSTRTPKPVYEWTESGPGFADFITGSNADDFLSDPINLPWSFNYYGMNVTQLKVCTNGWMTFDMTETDKHFQEAQIPANGSPNYVIAPLWDDLRNTPTVLSSGIYTRAIGSKFIVEWYKMRRFDSGGELDTLTFQAILDSRDSSVSFVYATSQDGGFAYGSSSQGSVGIEGDGEPTDGSNFYYHGDKILNKPQSGTVVKFALREAALNPLQPAAITGKAMRDADGSDATTNDRSPIANWKLNLLYNGTPVGTQTTDIDGKFAFRGIDPGTYDLVSDSGTGWINVSSIAGTGSSQIVSSARLRIWVGGSDSSENNTFVNFQPGIITGYKVNDLDGDELTTDDRIPFENAIIRRFYETGQYIDSAITNENGFFRFAMLPGGDYRLVDDTTGGWTPLTPLPGVGAQYTAVISPIILDVKMDMGDTVVGNTFINHSPTGSITTMSMSQRSGWNLVSVPVTVDDLHKNVLFPGSSSSAFGYENSSYVPTSMLEYGKGYWLKYNSDDAEVITGRFRTRDTIHVDSRWNIIGAVSKPTPVSAIIESPNDNIVSQFYGFNDGFEVADSLYPGKAYWVKVSQPGQLMINQSLSAAANRGTRGTSKDRDALLSKLSNLQFTDGAGKTKTLYFRTEVLDGPYLFMSEMPPVPPEGSFDIRYSSQRSIEQMPAERAKQEVRFQGVQFPLTVTPVLRDASSSYKLVETLNGRTIHSHDLADGATVTITSPVSGKLTLERVSKEIPEEITLHQNYPNPFNPTTVIEYDLPEQAQVTLKVFNMLGEQVATLVNEVQQPGYKSVEFSAGDERGISLPSGIYYYRLTAGDFTQSKMMVLVK